MNQFQLLREAEKVAEHARQQTHNPEAMEAISKVGMLYARLAEVRALIGEEGPGSLDDADTDPAPEGLPAWFNDAHGGTWNKVVSDDDMYNLVLPEGKRPPSVYNGRVSGRFGNIRVLYGPLSVETEFGRAPL